jgi:hypothetical protein
MRAGSARILGVGRKPGALTLSEDDRRVLAVWAADCADRTLSLFEDQVPSDPRPREAIEGLRAFARGQMPPVGPFDEPVSVTGATATWRLQLTDRSGAAWHRLAALAGLLAIGTDPTRWWFQRGWTDTGRPPHDEVRVSYSRLSNLEACELMHVLGDELGLGMHSVLRCSVAPLGL